MIHLSLSSLAMKSMYLLALSMVLSPAMAFSLVGNRNEFRFRTSSTRIHDVPRSHGVDPTKSFSFRVNYRNGNDEDHQHSQQDITSAYLSSTTTGRFQKTSTLRHHPAAFNDEDTSKKVDEYLEFLDKRYNRMRGIDGPQHKRKPFNMLKWLSHEDHTDHTEEAESNALYALGVAGLASERLLQKQGVSLTKCSIVQPASDDDSIVVDCESSPDTPSSLEGMPLLLNKIFATLTAKAIMLHRQVSARRRWMLKVLSQKSETAGKAALAAIPRASSNFVRTLVKAGGGERNLKFAATAMCAFAIYFAQPLVKSAITARTQV